MSDPYYDGASDALTEAEQEIKAAWIVTPVKREDYGSEYDFWREVALEAIRTLKASYDGDAKFVEKIRRAEA